MKTFQNSSFSKLIVLVMVIFSSIACNNTKTECDMETPITYTENIAPIIKAQCFECHAPDLYKKKASRNKIYDYPTLKKMAESGTLLGAITHSKGYVAMPYKKGTKIDTCYIATIAKWIDTGMKE